jgi:hypothetical protein
VSTIVLQCLLSVFPYQSAEVLRYQNYQIADLAYGSDSYEYLPFDFRSYPSQQLELADDSAEILIRNNDVVRSALQDYDGLRRAIVQVRQVQISNSLPDWFWQLQVYDTTPEAGFVRFSLRSPTSALTGPLVSRYFNISDFPELPVYKVNL